MSRFPLHVGYTGTRHGMTAAQIRIVDGLLRYKDFYGHHGDCIGGDEQFHAIVKGLPSARGVIVHPPTDSSRRAFCATDVRDVVHPPKEFHERNRDIVKAMLPPPGVWIGGVFQLDPSKIAESYFLIACPAEMHEQPKGGTWTTWRYARELRVPTKLILPNGMLFEEI